MNLREHPECRSYTDELVDKLQGLFDNKNERHNDELVLMALHEIMVEQDRAGWLSNEHRATRLVLEERIKT